MHNALARRPAQPQVTIIAVRQLNQRLQNIRAVKPGFHKRVLDCRLNRRRPAWHKRHQHLHNVVERVLRELAAQQRVLAPQLFQQVRAVYA